MSLLCMIKNVYSYHILVDLLFIYIVQPLVKNKTPNFDTASLKSMVCDVHNCDLYENVASIYFCK